MIAQTGTLVPPTSREKQREKQWGKYGIRGMTEVRYAEMWLAQDGDCAICGRPPTAKMRLGVDHDHSTGLPRGLLCTTCNSHLGWYETHRERVAEYLDFAEAAARNSEAPLPKTTTIQVQDPSPTSLGKGIAETRKCQES